MPFDSAGETRRTDDGAVTPFSLKLAFSKAADYARVDAVFDPAVKQASDPHGYVLKRYEPAFRKAVADGSAAFLSDADGNVMTLTMAYRFRRESNPDPDAHDGTELGTTFSRLPGFHSASLVVAAIALREWWQHPPAEAMMAEIKKSNMPSLKTYRDTLGWEAAPDTQDAHDLFAASYQTVLNDEGTGPAPPPARGTYPDVQLYLCPDSALATQAKILLSFMDQGGVLNRHTGQFLSVDFSALEEQGLSRARLEAIAGGETSRAALRALPPGPAAAPG